MVDSSNKLLWRMNRQRLDAEALRDSMLAVSDQLQESTGGPALALEFFENVNISLVDGNPAAFAFKKWRPGQKLQRTIYLPVIRRTKQPDPGEIRNIFDFPPPAEFSGQRAITAVPTQALFLMNSLAVKQHAGKLAERIKYVTAGDDARLDLLWLATLNRPITAREKQAAREFGSDSDKPWTELCHALLVTNEFLMKL